MKRLRARAESSDSGGSLKKVRRKESLAANESKPCFPNEIWLRLLCLMGPTDLGWLERVCRGFQEIILKECWPQFNQLAIRSSSDADDDYYAKIFCDGYETKPLLHSKAGTLVEKLAKWGSGLQSLELCAFVEPGNQYLHLLAGCSSKKISRLMVAILELPFPLVRTWFESLSAVLSIVAPTLTHLCLCMYVDLDEGDDNDDTDLVMEECGEFLRAPAAAACVNLHTLYLDLWSRTIEDDLMDILTPLNRTSGLLRNKPNLKELIYPGGYLENVYDPEDAAETALSNIMESGAQLETLAVHELALFLQAIYKKCEQEPQLMEKQPCFHVKELRADCLYDEYEDWDFNMEIPSDATIMLTLCPRLEKIVFVERAHLGTLGDLIVAFLAKFHKQPESKHWLIELLDEWFTGRTPKSEIKEAVLERDPEVCVEDGEDPTQDLIFIKGSATLTLHPKQQLQQE